MCTWRRYVAAILLAGAWARPAAAQFGVSGEATATFGRHDDNAFFNYTDYEHNALRMFRLSLAGVWRPTDRLAFLAEVRSEDVQDVVPYALFVRAKSAASRQRRARCSPPRTARAQRSVRTRRSKRRW